MVNNLSACEPYNYVWRKSVCYSLYISTDSPEDLSGRNSELIRFEKITDSNGNPCVTLLDFPNQWYIGSISGCSCEFRHLVDTALGFSDPVDWYEEQQEDLDATAQLYSILADILSAGAYVDIIDVWQGARPEDIRVLEVSFADVSKSAFRLFENHKFMLRAAKRP
jgi:hypothetical protein